MTETLETQLYNTLETNPDSDTIKTLIEQGVDCNLPYFNCNLSDFNRHLSRSNRNFSHFNRCTNTFISPIQLATKPGRHDALLLLYEHRNSPTKIQLEKHVTFYINHHDRSHKEKNETLFDYTVSRLLYTRITTEHSKNVFDTSIAALHDYDKGEHRGESLSGGSKPEISLQLRIYTLFRMIIDMKIDSDNEMLEVIENELLHNLETYYFLDGIEHIPVVIPRQTINQSFAQKKALRSLLIRYYRCIAKNAISKIEQLDIDQEYTIPAGWIGHVVCVSFRRISQTHIIIRIDNLSPLDLLNPYEIDDSMGNKLIKPKVLGQLHVDNLKVNLDYFILLIHTIKRDVTLKEGSSLIYNVNKQILHLEEIHIENLPSFVEQADANCFVKCFEPGLWIRVGETHEELYEQLLLLEQNNANILAKQCEKEHKRQLNDVFSRFKSLAEEEDMSTLPVTERTRLQLKLKTSYKQLYKHLLSSANIEYCPLLDDIYVPLRFENNNTRIELKNLSIRSRVLMLGEAGCGKTTVCQYITYSWASGKLWRNQFEWLFYIKMRNLNSEVYPRQSNNYSLIDIIKKECFEGSKLDHLDKQKLANQFENSSNILWILDGCDERTIPEYLHSIEQDLLAKPYLLLTSRPYATHNFQYDSQIQIQSFTHQDIENYIHNYFSFTLRTTGNECWSFIHKSHQMLQTACIPACLEIICSLWENSKETLDAGMTMGELYQKTCDYLLRRYLLKFHRLCNSALIGRNIYQEPNAIAFAHLEYLAFEATKAYRLTVRGQEITKVAGLLSLSVLQIVLLIPRTRDASDIFLENIYYFVHRSFQEYLCARYMIRILESSGSNEQKKEVVQFITHEKYNRRARDTFRLFFEMTRSNLCTDQFWSAVHSEPRDLVGLRHCSRIAHWFPKGSCIFSLEDKSKIDKSTSGGILAWISNTDRLPHDFGNTYIFEWFSDATDQQCWLKAWKEDLLIEDSSRRRYFFPDVWSTENIDALKIVYDEISQNIQALHRLITIGPSTINLKRLGLDPNLFTLYTVDDQTKTSEFIIAAQKQAREHKSITTLAEFEALLQNYASFANLNRQSAARGEETWRLKIAPSALENINNETLHLILQLSQENALFFRYFKLPVIQFLELYAKRNDLNNDFLSLIVSIAISSDCILTAPPYHRRSIRVHENETFVDIEMDEHRRSRLISEFDRARDAYGYSCFFRQDD